MFCAATGYGSQCGRHGCSMFKRPRRKEERQKQQQSLVSNYTIFVEESPIIQFCSCAALLKRRRLAWRIWCEYVMVRREKRRVQHEVDQWAATRTVRYGKSEDRTGPSVSAPKLLLSVPAPRFKGTLDTY